MADSETRHLHALARAILRWPHGHVNNEIAAKLSAWHGRKIWLAQDVAELAGLIARAKFLIDNPPDSGSPDAPTGGTPTLMAIAA